LRTCLTVAALVLVALLPVIGLAQGDTNRDPNARQLVVVDREGKTLIAVAERGLYSQPAFSPDGTRLAVTRTDTRTQDQDILAVDLSSGALTQITSDPTPEASPVWSPDGGEIVFVSVRGGKMALYRRASSGVGDETPIYRHTGFGGISNPEWSNDGRSLTFSDLINISGAMYSLPLEGDPKPTEFLRPPLFGARMSPDRRFVLFQSAQSGRTEIYVRALAAAAASTGEQWQLTRSGALSTIAWRQDGRELFYLAADRGVMAVEVTTTPTFTVGAPRLLFYAPESILALGRAAVAGLLNASRDGRRFVFVVLPVPVERQLIVLDRHGTKLATPAGPSTWGQPAMSPDGRRAAVVRTDPQTGNQDIWTVDLATGKSAALTDDASPDTAPVWSPDGRYIAFVSTRGDYTNIYRKVWNQSRSEELVYRNEPGASGLVLTDWSADGRFLSFYSADVLCVLPLAGDRKPIEVARTEFSTIGGRFSPDGRQLAYLSDESGRYEVYVRALDASVTARSGAQERVWQVSRDGAQGMIFWRQDGEELGYLATDGTVMSATSGPSGFSAPSPVFRPPNLAGGGPYGAIGNVAQLKNVSGDGRRFLVAVPTQ